MFNRWCHSKEIGQDFKKLKQMFLLEEFKDKVRPDIRSHLDEPKEKAAVMADDYALTHKIHVPNVSWSQNMTGDSDFVQSIIKQSPILFPSPESQTA